jgi:DNA repair protein RadC
MAALPEPLSGGRISVDELAPRAMGPRGARPGWESASDAELLRLITGGHPEAVLALLDDIGGIAALGGPPRAAPADGPGLRPAQADRLAWAIELARRMASARTQPGWRIRSPADVGERLRPAMRHLEREELRTLLLNTKNVVTSVQTVYVGNLAGSSVRVGEVFRDAVRCQAAAIVVVHNHPSGDPTPSADDLRITAELAQAGRLLDIELLDHVVIGADGWVSLRSLGVT